jgi:predicted DNA-binding transcriptional regulator YafY
MYSPATRLLFILHSLHRGTWVSGQELANALEVDVRTVRRYVTLLRDLGVPVEAAPGRDGGYNLASETRLPPTIFTQDELEALRAILEATQPALGSAAASALDKIRQILQEI